MNTNQINELPRLVKERGVTAAQCVNDTTASPVMRALQAAGYAVPADVSVFGFDNSIICKHMPVKLSTVIQPFEEIGKAAAKLIDDAVEKNLSVISQIFIPVTLKLRDSHAPPRA